MALIEVKFMWDDRFGLCLDCGNPAAFLVDGETKVCSVCAANHAADGSSISWIQNPY